MAISPEKKELAEMIKKEQDPYTKELLTAVRAWWKKPWFEVPGNNILGIEEGIYERDELFPVLIGGYKPIVNPADRTQLVQTSRTLFAAMLICEDKDPLFESTWKSRIEAIDS